MFFSVLSNKVQTLKMCICVHKLEKGTSRQRSGKGAIRKKIPTPKTEAEKTKAGKKKDLLQN